MKPHCPNCLKEMTKAPASRNLFNCEPCREIIQYFGRSADHGKPGPQFSSQIRRKRAAHTAHAA
jgi:ribosomal protein L37AE/L43A